MRTPFPSPRLAKPLLALAVACALAACGPNVGKADSYEQLADGLSNSQAFPAAAEALQKSIKYDPNEPRRWLKLGRVQRAMGQSAQAAQSYQHALDLDPANVEGLENMAILMVRGGNFKEARSYVDPLLSLAPDDVAGLLAIGAIKMYQGDFAEADKYADRLIQVDPSGVGGYSLKAHVLDSQGRPAAAAAILAQQVALNPTDTDLALQLMDLYRKSGNLGGVRDTAIILTKLLPDDPRYKLESARALHAKGQDDAAAKLIATLQRQYRGNPDVIRAIADYWFSTLPHDAAIGKVLTMTQALAGRSQAALGNLLIDRGRAVDAVRLLAPVGTKAVAQGNTEVHAAYARGLLTIGRGAQARKVAQDVLNFDPSNDAALVVRARTSLDKRDFDGALTDAQLAVSTNDQNEDAARLVPKVYAAQGNAIMAEKAWGDAQNNLPDSVAVFRERMAWLVSQKRGADAIDIAAVFTRGHPDSLEAWTIYRQLCVGQSDKCAIKAANQVKALGG